jgi:diamine N-acetyltransferase
MSGKHKEIELRALEPEDIDILYDWENSTENWEVSNTHLPFSKSVLKEYIQHAQKSLYDTGQIRLVICHKDTKDAIGLIDLFDYDSFHHRAGVGILIRPESRGKSFAKSALCTLLDYAFNQLMLNQLYCNILKDNIASLKLFKSVGFICIGEKKEWVRTNVGYKDEIMLQLLKSDYFKD